MKILVLGGSRYIGRRLVSDLLDQGHDVTLYNRGRTEDGFGDGVQRLQGDRRSLRDMSAAFMREDFDIAYDFLCFDAEDARTLTTALGKHVGRLVLISTCSVYWCTGDFPCPVPEDDFDRFGDFVERPSSIEFEYGYGKRKAERRLRDAAGEDAFSLTIFRLPIVAGESDPSLRHASYCARLNDGRPLILPDGGLAPLRQVYAGDVTRALANLAGSKRSADGAFNLASTEILSVRSLLHDIAELMGRNPETVEIPVPLLRRMSSREDATVFSPFTQSAAQVPAIDKARRELGWRPTPYKVWLERIVRWWVDSGSKAGRIPPAYMHRDHEIKMIERFRRAVTNLSGEDGLDGLPRG